MNASAWFVFGLFVGAIITVLVYEADRRSLQKAADFWEHRCEQMAKAYEAETRERR